MRHSSPAVPNQSIKLGIQAFSLSSSCTPTSHLVLNLPGLAEEKKILTTRKIYIEQRICREKKTIHTARPRLPEDNVFQGQ